MTFTVAAEAYDRFMGRYSQPLAPLFAEFAGVQPGMRVLDVGCGPGALTRELAKRVTAERVSAVEPAPQFAESCRARNPGVDVRQAAAEALPFESGTFDVALAQLVLSFMADADAGMAQMRRVVRPGGTVAVCMWAAGEKMELLSTFWEAADLVDPRGHAADARMPYRTREALEAAARRAGLTDVRSELLTVHTDYPDLDALWATVADAAGPLHDFVSKLDAGQRSTVREALARKLAPRGTPLTLSGSAWAVRGQV